MPWTPTACPSLRPVPSRAETSPVQLMLRIRMLTMTGSKQVGVWVGTPMPRHSAYALTHSIDKRIQSAKRINPFNATQRDWCGSIQHSATASSTHLHGQSHGLSGYTRRGDGTSNNACPKGRGAGGDVEVRPERVNRWAESLKNEVPKKRPPIWASLSRPQGLANGLRNTPQPIGVLAPSSYHLHCPMAMHGQHQPTRSKCNA